MNVDTCHLAKIGGVRDWEIGLSGDQVIWRSGNRVIGLSGIRMILKTESKNSYLPKDDLPISHHLIT